MMEKPKQPNMVRFKTAATHQCEEKQKGFRILLG